MDKSRDERVEEFVQLLGSQERSLYAYILSLLPNWADADEIAQQTRVRLWQQFDQYDPEKNFGAWARTIAYYLVLAYRKESQREQARLSPEFVEAVAARAEEVVSDELESRQAALSDCLKKLSEPHRALLKRYYSGREDRKAIAADIGRSFDATRQSVQRIRRTLTRCIEDLAIQEASE